MGIKSALKCLEGRRRACNARLKEVIYFTGFSIVVTRKPQTLEVHVFRMLSSAKRSVSMALKMNNPRFLNKLTVIDLHNPAGKSIFNLTRRQNAGRAGQTSRPSLQQFTLDKPC